MHSIEWFAHFSKRLDQICCGRPQVLAKCNDDTVIPILKETFRDEPSAAAESVIWEEGEPPELLAQFVPGSEIRLDGPVKALVVDDEPVICEYLSSVLKDLDFDVLTAGTVDSAVATALQTKKFEVAFIDLGLPDRSGLELIDELHALHPQLRCIIVTGYADRVRLDMEQTGKRQLVLEKPFTLWSVHNALVEAGLQP